MAEADYNNKTNDPERAAEKKGRKSRIILGVIVVLLVLLNGFLGYLYFNKKAETEEKKKALIKSKEIKEDLKKELSEMEGKNKNLKGKNQHLDSLLAKRDRKIKNQASEIRKLVRKNRIKVQQYKKAREKLETLRYYKKKYRNKIDSLIRVNKELKEENYNLRTEVRETKKQKDKLKDKNVRLENKVAQGSRLKLKSAKVTGIKIQNDGDKKETDNTNKIDQIKVCFNFQENPIAEKGPRRVLIRLMNPKGETIYIQSRGSGQFSYKNDTALYTFSEQVKFKNKDQPHCVYWSRGDEFPEGKYTMLVYTNGYLVGEKKFELKSGFLGIF